MSGVPLCGRGRRAANPAPIGTGSRQQIFANQAARAS